MCYFPTTTTTTTTTSNGDVGDIVLTVSETEELTVWELGGITKHSQKKHLKDLSWNNQHNKHRQKKIQKPKNTCNTITTMTTSTRPKHIQPNSMEQKDDDDEKEEEEEVVFSIQRLNRYNLNHLLPFKDNLSTIFWKNPKILTGSDQEEEDNFHNNDHDALHHSLRCVQDAIPMTAMATTATWCSVNRTILIVTCSLMGTIELFQLGHDQIERLAVFPTTSHNLHRCRLLVDTSSQKLDLLAIQDDGNCCALLRWSGIDYNQRHRLNYNN